MHILKKGIISFLVVFTFVFNLFADELKLIPVWEMGHCNDGTTCACYRLNKAKDLVKVDAICWGFYEKLNLYRQVVYSVKEKAATLNANIQDLKSSIIRLDEKYRKAKTAIYVLVVVTVVLFGMSVAEGIALSRR